MITEVSRRFETQKSSHGALGGPHEPRSGLLVEIGRREVEFCKFQFLVGISKLFQRDSDDFGALDRYGCVRLVEIFHLVLIT